MLRTRGPAALAKLPNGTLGDAGYALGSSAARGHPNEYRTGTGHFGALFHFAKDVGLRMPADSLSALKWFSCRRLRRQAIASQSVARLRYGHPARTGRTRDPAIRNAASRPNEVAVLEATSQPSSLQTTNKIPTSRGKAWCLYDESWSFATAKSRAWTGVFWAST